MSQTDDRPPILKLTWPLFGSFVAVELLFTAVIVGAIFLFCVRNDGRASESENAEKAVKDLLVQQNDDWNKGDLDKYMEGYWNDDGLTFYSGGTITKGWKATRDRYRQRYQAEGKEMGKLTFSDLIVDVFDPSRAMARGRWKLTMKDGSTPNGLFTVILRRIDGQWRVVHDHTSIG